MIYIPCALAGLTAGSSSPIGEERVVLDYRKLTTPAIGTSLAKQYVIVLLQ